MLRLPTLLNFSNTNARSNTSTTDIQPVSQSPTGESSDQISALLSPPFPDDAPLSSGIPPWLRDAMPSGAARHSRASSIVSTRTKFSMTSLQEDARSIDIHVGGQYFRIARDGSRITDAPPPPYSGSYPASLNSPIFAFDGNDTPTLRAQSRDGLSFLDSARSSMISNSSQFDNYDREGAATPTQQSPVPSLRPLRANIIDPREVDIPSPVTDNNEAHLGDDETPTRNLSYREGLERISVPPEATRSRIAPPETVKPSGPVAQGLTSPLRRRNGVQLPPLDTTTLNNRPVTSTANHQPMQGVEGPSSAPLVRSAGPVLYRLHQADEPQSPNYIGRNARGIFPRTQTTPYAGARSISGPMAGHSTQEALRTFTDAGDESTGPPPMDSENDISLHYARLMRQLDREHRKALHLKDRELEQLRERINEVDTVYRQELRARDFIIEDLKKRLDHLQEIQEIRLEKARHEVEDIWECRWKERDFHLRERMRRIEEEANQRIDRILAGRQQAEERIATASTSNI